MGFFSATQVHLVFFFFFFTLEVGITVVLKQRWLVACWRGAALRNACKVCMYLCLEENASSPPAASARMKSAKLLIVSLCNSCFLLTYERVIDDAKREVSV